MIKVGIVGAAGNAGLMLLKLLEGHKKASVELACDIHNAGKKVTALLPNTNYGLKFSKLSTKELNKLDVTFLALPHGIAKYLAPQLKCKVIDLSADHRMTNTYGLPELFKKQIKESNLIANPGCYATACILASYPLRGLLKEAVFNGISGYSGGGKNPKYDFEENIMAYKLTSHHQLKELSKILGFDFSFTPHVVNSYKGILCTAHLSLKEEVDAKTILKEYKKFYKETFTKPGKKIPCTKDVIETPYCNIGGFETTGKHIIIVSAIDNLMKGAASQAIENMNLMFGLNRKEGLKQPGCNFGKTYKGVKK